MDVNGDGRINVYDLTEMRKSFASTGVFTESVYSADEKNVRYIGRNYLDSNNTAWLVQSGSAVEFTVNAKSAEITIAGDSSVNNEEKYRPRYAVLVDGEVILDDILSEKAKTVKVFEGDKSRTATVKVIHLSEANNGAVGVSQIKVNSDFSVPVFPTAKKDLQIEFIGDSITCAYGVEAHSNGDQFTTATENFMKSYAYLTAQKLNADYSAVSYSGHGIISGYTTTDEKNTDSLVPPYYKNCGSFSEYAKPWNFEKSHNDVVVINLGTNDSSYIDKDFENRSQEFIDGYVDFISEIRECNPDAYIICTLGIMGCEKEYPLIAQAVEEYSSKSGDSRIISYQSPTQNPADGYGADWHPSEITQQKNAYILSDKICSVLGIESDQIGLDVASDADYTVSIDPSSGANASTFFSDYDKSFWINMVNGGSSKDSIEALISPIGIKKNGKYRLTFNCTTADGVEIPVILRSADGSKEYFSDTFSANGEKAPFEAEFTADISDENAQLVFKIGGKDYYNVTLYNLRLEKIG